MGFQITCEARHCGNPFTSFMMLDVHHGQAPHGSAQTCRMTKAIRVALILDIGSVRAADACPSACVTANSRPFSGRASACFITMPRLSFIHRSRANVGARKAFGPAESGQRMLNECRGRRPDRLKGSYSSYGEGTGNLTCVNWGWKALSAAISLYPTSNKRFHLPLIHSLR